jgi:uncharacterized membrane protein
MGRESKSTSAARRGVKGLWALNFTFVGMGALYFLGMVQPIFRLAFGARPGTVAVFTLAVALQLFYIVCAAFALYHGLIFLFAGGAALRRTSRRVAALRDRGAKVTRELRREIRREEFSRGRMQTSP